MPIIVHILITRAYGKFIFALRIMLMDAAKVVKRVRYIPVAEGTIGCISN